MLKIFNFECPLCHTVFEALVEGTDGQPDGCPQCASTEPFKKLIACSNLASTIVVDYPGSKQFKAGYQHTHNRPAERKGTQISMYQEKSNVRSR